MRTGAGLEEGRWCGGQGGGRCGVVVVWVGGRGVRSEGWGDVRWVGRWAGRGGAVQGSRPASAGPSVLFWLQVGCVTLDRGHFSLSHLFIQEISTVVYSRPEGVN